MRDLNWSYKYELCKCTWARNLGSWFRQPLTLSWCFPVSKTQFTIASLKPIVRLLVSSQYVLRQPFSSKRNRKYIYFRHLSSAVFTAIMLMWPSKYLKKLFKSNILGLRIPAGRKQTGWLFSRGAKIWTRDYRQQMQEAVRTGLELGASELQVQRSNCSATRPPVFNHLREVLRTPWNSLKRFQISSRENSLSCIFIISKSGAISRNLCTVKS